MAGIEACLDQSGYDVCHYLEREAKRALLDGQSAGIIILASRWCWNW